MVRKRTPKCVVRATLCSIAGRRVKLNHSPVQLHTSRNEFESKYLLMTRLISGSRLTRLVDHATPGAPGAQKIATTARAKSDRINHRCHDSIIVRPNQYHTTHNHHRRRIIGQPPPATTASTTASTTTTNNMLATAAARLASSTSGPAAAASLPSSLPRWATLDPSSLGSDPVPHAVLNLVNGSWVGSEASLVIPNPMDRDAPPVCTVPDTGAHELGPFVESLRGVPKSGVHNPLRNVERYRQFGEISRKVRGGGGFARLPRSSSFIIPSRIPCMRFVSFGVLSLGFAGRIYDVSMASFFPRCFVLGRSSTDNHMLFRPIISSFSMR